jgi:hypothetical protein
VAWTPIFGSTGIADDERVPATNYLDVDLAEGGPITALHSLNSVFVWKYRAMYKLVGTGDAVTPYLLSQISETIGCIRHQTVVGGEDENGKWPIIVHPPADETIRAFNDKADDTLGHASYLKRNRDIVDACDLIFVCPNTMEHRLQSGTWYTHDYAVKKNKMVAVIYPDGKCVHSIKE